MNRCRMNLRILITLLAIFALLASAALAKAPLGPRTPKAVKGTVISSQSPIVKDAGPGGSVIINDQEIRYQGEMSKTALHKVSEEPAKALPTSSYLAEDFETAVPPASWSEIILNAGYNWKQQTLDSYSGLASADVEYDPSLAAQDEWLVSSVVDLTAATSDLRIEFYWAMSYYWSTTVDNYDLELWISTDGGATWPTKLWDESGESAFTDWVFYLESVDLSGYVGQSNVKFAWRYAGSDGAQALIDYVNVIDDPEPIGRCCYTGTCADVTQADCATLGGVWDDALNCTDNPCPTGPANDNCSSAIAIGDVVDMAFDPTGATLDGPGGFISNRNIWYSYTASCTGNATVSLCGSSYDTRVRVWPDENCPTSGTGLAFDDDACNGPGSGLASITIFPVVTGNKYLIEVAPYLETTTIGTGLMTVSCALAVPGDNCGDPYVITVGTLDLPFVAANLSNCGRLDDYENTCLGSYDTGEDMIIQLVLTEPVLVDLTLDPKGTTWSAMAIDDVCPLDAATGSCLGIVATSSGTTKSINGLNLAAGTYFIMIDTYSTPDCIPDFDLTIAGAAPPPVNDACANAIATGDVVSLPFSTTSATFDGGGTCLTSPNVWYCYTAPLTGAARISLCGSGYDTKMAVYDGCACGPLGAQLACNDDFCGLQSEVSFPVVMGNQYRIEVGGYSANVGNGVLSITSFVPPPNDNCTDVTPVVLTSGVPVTFTGDNTNATDDCTLFPGPNVWEAFTITECSNVTLDYCGTAPAFGNAWLNLAIGCPCVEFTPGGAFDVTTCPDGNVTIFFSALTAGTYYYPVMNDAANGAVGPYTINVVSEAVTEYCAADGFCDEYISRVQLAGLDNSSSCDASYSDFTSLSADLVQTVDYTLTITNGLAYTSDLAGAWIDWNGDLCFDATEEVVLAGGPSSWTATIAAPLTAAIGPTRMRLRITYDELPVPCGTSEYGEVEDYTINVIELAPAAKVTPHPQYMYYKFAVTPISNTFYFGMFDDGYVASDVNLSTITINGIPAAGAGVVASYPGFAGEVVAATLPLTTFLNPYGLLYDVNNMTFTVAWEYNDAVPDDITDDVVIIGKSTPVPGRYIVPDVNFVIVPGDWDLDGVVNISDAMGIISYIFAGGQPIGNLMIGDTDCSKSVNISDAVNMISYIFAGGAAPCVANH